MKEKETGGEDEERPAVREIAGFGPRLVGAPPRRRAVSALRIDLARRDRAQRDERRSEQQDGDDENGARRDKADGAHRRRRQPVSNRGKARVPPEPLADRDVADETEADGGNGRAEHAAGKRMQNRRR